MGDYGNAMMRNPIAGAQYQAKAQGRANNAQLKLIAQNHPTGLTANLLKLFEPGPPLEYKSPAEKRQFPAYSGIAQFVTQFAEPGDSEYAPSIPKSETRVRLVIDKETKKPRGYAFIEYVHTRDMKNAYKHADGMKVDSRRVVVDVECGRTVPNWRPRRLGGGLGLGRFSGDGADHKCPSREQQLAGHPRSEEPRTRRDDHHADRDLEKSRERMRERDRGERTSARSHEQTRDRESRGERYSDKDRDRTWEKDQVRDTERDRGYDRDR